MSMTQRTEDRKTAQDAKAALRMQTPGKGGKCKTPRCKGVVPRKRNGVCPVCDKMYIRGECAPK